MGGGELRTAALFVGSGDSETSIDRTMIEMDQIFPLDTVETAPVAPVFVDGERTVTLKGEHIAEEFQAIVDAYVVRRYGAQLKPAERTPA